MAGLCTGCGKELPDGAVFCTECGTPAPTETPTPQAQPQAAPAPERAAPSPSAYTRSGSAEQPPTGRYSVVGTGTYFGSMFLFAIPVVGWLICAITAFASKNDNKKHFARAMLIWLLIGLILAVAGYFVFRWLDGMIKDYINAEFGGQFDDLQELVEQFRQFEGGGLMPPIG